MIECHDLYSPYRANLGRPILNGINLKIQAGECVSLLGLNGAGKSSLLKALAGLVPIEKGEILINGMGMSGKTLPAIRRQLGMIWQGGGLIPQLCALDNVLCGRLGSMSSWSSLWGFPANDRHQAHALLSQFGLGQASQTKVCQLSGGQQQRVAIARALMESPPILLADEPTASLDPLATQQVMEILLKLRYQGITLILVLHDLALASYYTERAIILEQGRVIYDGTSDHLEQEYANLC